MDWLAATESEIWDKINKACGRMSPEQDRLWEAIKVMPEKWRQSPYGDPGGGFWVVTVVGRRVIWFNDIEDGFNCSMYTMYGVIDEYWCNQDELEEVVRRMLNLLQTGHDSWGSAGPPMPLKT